MNSSAGPSGPAESRPPARRPMDVRGASVLPAPPTRVGADTDPIAGSLGADPYRWLEDAASEEVGAWVAAQNQRTQLVVDSLPVRRAAGIAMRAYPPVPLAATSGLFPVSDDVIVTREVRGGSKQLVLCRRSTHVGEPVRIVVDPSDDWSGDPFTIGDVVPSATGTRLAYGQAGRNERQVVRVMDPDGNHERDVIDRLWITALGWVGDDAVLVAGVPLGHDGLRSEQPAELWLHTLGTSSDADVMLWRHVDPSWWPGLVTGTDDTIVLVLSSKGDDSAFVVISRDGVARSAADLLGPDLGLVWIEPGSGSMFGVRHAETGDELVVRPEGQAGEVSVVFRTVPAWNIVGIVTQRHHALVHLRGGGVSALALVTLATGEVQLVDMPEPGEVRSFTVTPSSATVFFEFSSFTRPNAQFRWSADVGLVPWPPDDELPPLRPGYEYLRRPRSEADAAPTARLETIDIPMDDGEHVPALVAVPATSSTPQHLLPTLVHVYGGFGIPIGAGFDAFAHAWVSLGGRHISAGVRGGGERGREWHEAGSGANKERCVQDALGVLEWLHLSGTPTSSIALRGRSHGGWLVAAVAVTAPQACAAVLCEVPVSDLVRFEGTGTGSYIIGEWADNERPDDAERLARMSPYRTAIDGAPLPAMLIASGGVDTRADAGHARKLAARLQVATSRGDEAPILLRSWAFAGHDAGMSIEELAERLAFLAWGLGMRVDVE